MGREWEAKPQWTGRVLNVHAGALREVGDLAASRRLSHEGLEAGVEAAFLGASVSAKIDLALTDLLEGEIGQAERQMPELLQAVEDFHGWHQWLWTGRLADIQAVIALGSGRLEEAASKADEALRYLRRYPRPKYEARAYTSHGQAMLALGLLDEASTSFRRAVERADGLRQAVLQWPALDGLATSLERSGREEEAEDARRRAREVIEGRRGRARAGAAVPFQREPDRPAGASGEVVSPYLQLHGYYPFVRGDDATLQLSTAGDTSSMCQPVPPRRDPVPPLLLARRSLLQPLEGESKESYPTAQLLRQPSSMYSAESACPGTRHGLTQRLGRYPRLPAERWSKHRQ